MFWFEFLFDLSWLWPRLRGNFRHWMKHVLADLNFMRKCWCWTEFAEVLVKYGMHFGFSHFLSGVSMINVQTYLSKTMTACARVWLALGCRCLHKRRLHVTRKSEMPVRHIRKTKRIEFSYQKANKCWHARVWLTGDWLNEWCGWHNELDGWHI